MPNIDIATPASSAPTDRLALGVGWVRPGAGSIGGTLNPSSHSFGVGCGRGVGAAGAAVGICGRGGCACFEGNEE